MGFIIYSQFFPENFLEKKGSLTNKLQWAFKTSLSWGLIWSIYDINTLTRLTNRRQQILRGIFFTVPAVAAGTGYVAAVEILSKMLGPQNKRTAWAMAGLVPAGVYSVWRRRFNAFPIQVIGFGMLGYLYQMSVEENLYFGNERAWANPNDPFTSEHRNKTIFGEMRKYEVLRPDLSDTLLRTVPDPGPSYAKFEN